MKKLTIDFVREQFEKEGYTLLSEEYINSYKPLKFKCSNNHIHKISYGAFKKGQRCIKCFHGGLRDSIEDIKKAFVREGYILLTDSYINSNQKLEYICSDGHRSSTSWKNWKFLGNRCRHCAKNVKHTFDFVKDSFSKEGYTLLSTRYKNQKQKLNYICPLGHNNSITWTDWRNGGYRCPTCYFIRNSGPGNYAWKGGISYEPYCPIWKDKEYKEDIKKRDGYRCLNPCCASKKPNDLTIHHIDYNKKNCGPSNLITVCRVCNIRANIEREWHISWYQAILSKRYNYKY